MFLCGSIRFDRVLVSGKMGRLHNASKYMLPNRIAIGWRCPLAERGLYHLSESEGWLRAGSRWPDCREGWHRYAGSHMPRYMLYMPPVNLRVGQLPMLRWNL